MDERVTIEVDRGDGRPDVVWLDNGVLRLGLVPAAGGRLLSVALGARETLWRDRTLLDDRLHPVAGHRVAPHDGPLGSWVNYGGDKTWPAPQGWGGPQEWAGPPDPVLDSGPYSWTTRTAGDGSAAIELVSGAGAACGLRIERHVSLAPDRSAYEVLVSGTNVSDRPIRWALWNVTQRAADEPGAGGVRVGVDSRDPRVVALVQGTGSPRVEPSPLGTIALPHQDVVGKVGFPTATGWLAHAARGVTTCLMMPVVAGAEYPDQGSRVEIWMEHPLDRPLEHVGGLQPSARIVELELLGPLTTLAPGGQLAIGFVCGSTVGDDLVEHVTAAGHWTSTGESGPRTSFGAYVSGRLVLDDVTTVARTRAGEVCSLPSGEPVAGRQARVVEDGTGAEIDAGRVPGERR